MERRKIEERIFLGLMLLSTVIILSSLVLILLTVLLKGLPYLTMDMVTKVPEGGYYLGKGGGILNAIAGSLYLGVGATLLALLFSLPVALYMNVYSRPGSRFVFSFGFTIMIYLGMRASLLGGIIAIALLILPMLIRSMDEVIRLVPRELVDASF